MPKTATKGRSLSRKAVGSALLSATDPPKSVNTRSFRHSRTIENSSTRDSDLEFSDNQGNDLPIKASSRRRVLHAVAIPSGGKQSTMKASYQSPSASSPSLDVCPNDLSNEYETPGTSAVATPAESAGLKTQMIAAPGNMPLSQRGKRKRPVDDVCDTLREDELLAQRLQEEEYADGSITLAKSLPHGIADSDNQSDSVLSEPDSEYSFDFESHKISAGTKIKRFSSCRMAPRRRPMQATGPKRRRQLVISASDLEDHSEEDLPESSSQLSNFGLSVMDSNDDENVIQDGGPSSHRQPFGLHRGVGKVSMYSSRAAYERAKLEKAHPEINTLWDDLAAIPKITPVCGEQPAGISRKLKSFQLEGLDWMRKQEESCYKGGLLGDEMGMGKTIQAVSLIMSDHPAKDPTLVVVPPVALLQWSSEIAAYTDGKLKVLVHHNTDPKIKKLTAKDLKKYDVIMISYSGLESIHRKETKGWKRDDGLVKENSRIHAVHYHRLILDEAHSIKSRTTGVAKACFALRASYKWCLSGTPVQNRIGEFFSLLRFLEVRPFALYFCKSCSCAELHWSQDEEKKCTHCSHSGFSHVSIFNQELLTPLTSATDQHLRREALAKLRLLTDRIMLRRLKRDHTSSMELPPKEVVIHHEFFGEIERDFSSSIMGNTGRQFDTYVSRGVMLNNYANIFGLIMQMRQVANHPDLILKKHAEGGQNVLVCSICDETAEEPIRSRCNHEFCRKCAKDYMRSFENNIVGDNMIQPDCPRCHIELSIDFDQPDIEQDEDHVKKNSIINRIKMEDWTSSTKIEMLVYDLYKLRKKSQTHKSIVFSQFTSMLQLVEWRLRRAGFNTVMLDGSMSPAQRQKSIEYFMNNIDVEVFLVSLKAGGVALNLTEASRVFIVDPWWNPAAEWQSADRCHRIGQKRPCSITRLCIEDSVESRIVLLQEKKAKLIASTVNNDDVAMEKLTPEDMQFLFRGS